MDNSKTRHIGKNIRAIRLLRGMKQETFARQMGIAQQNVSKMEKKKKITDQQLEQAAKILNTSVDFLKNFDDKAVFQTNIINENQVNHFNSTKEILEYFENKLGRKDDEINSLKAELESYRNQDKAKKQSPADNMYSIESKIRKAAAKE